jgi:hypothetical protein
MIKATQEPKIKNEFIGKLTTVVDGHNKHRAMQESVGAPPALACEYRVSLQQWAVGSVTADH